MPKKTWRETGQWLMETAGRFLKAKQLQELRERFETMERTHERMCEAFASIHDALGMTIKEDEIEISGTDALRGIGLVRSVRWARKICQEAGIPITVKDNNDV